MKEVAPDMQVSEDVLEEPEPQPVEGICHVYTDTEEVIICPLLSKLCFLMFSIIPKHTNLFKAASQKKICLAIFIKMENPPIKHIHSTNRKVCSDIEILLGAGEG